MNAALRIKDGFQGEKQINIPREVIVNVLRKQGFLNNLFITQIGYFPKAKYHFRERTHGCHDNILIYCVEGKGFYETQEGRYTLRANEFMILPHGEYHSYQADLRDPWSIYWIHFSGNQLKDLNNWIDINEYKEPTSLAFDTRIITQWHEIYSVLDSGLTKENLAYANLCLYGFLSNFLCPAISNPVVHIEDPIGDSIGFMKAHIDQLMTVEELAARVGYSCSHYTSLFRSKTGSAPIDYFIRLKVNYACQLLRQTNLKINEVAGKLGYEDSFYFSRLFKKISGSSPKDYRGRAAVVQMKSIGQ